MFQIVKTPAMADHYAELGRSLAPIGTVVELGIFRGGSTALLNELLRPGHLVAVDIASESGSLAFDRYAAEHPTVETLWGVSQADRDAVLSAIGVGPLDLVVDDGSHLYGLTAASFDLLFPLVRPGGVYVIEDWNWPFNPSEAESIYWRGHRSLSDLILDLAGLSVARPGIIERIELRGSLLIVEHGPADATGINVRRDPYRRSNWLRNAAVDRIRRPLSRIKRRLLAVTPRL